MERLAIITARGGSKRIPRKNIKLFLGRPIIQYSIEAALDSGYFDEVMVSTDDSEIAEIARLSGAVVPFMRSAQNSDDFTGTADVLIEVLDRYAERGQYFDQFCCIYPTAPFVTAEKLKIGMELLSGTGADCVLPVVHFSYPIERCLRVRSEKVVMEKPENYPLRSQDFEPAFHDAGQFYCLNTSSFKQQRRLFADNTVPLFTSPLEVQDIDNIDDWSLAELKYSLLNGSR